MATTIKELANDPEFRKLPEYDKRDIIASIDPSFKELPFEDQKSFLSELAPITRGNQFGEPITGERAKNLAEDRVSRREEEARGNETPQQRFSRESPTKKYISDLARPTLETAGLLGGGVVGTTAGPAGTVGGAALGYAGGKATANALDYALGVPEAKELAKRTVPEIALETTGDIATGAASEMGGPVLAKSLGAVSKYTTEPIAKYLRQSAEKNIFRTLNPTTLENKAITEKITPKILEKPVETFAFTQRGLQEKAEMAREAAGEAIEKYGSLKGDVNPSGIVNILEKLKQKYKVEGVDVDPSALNNIQKVQDTFKEFGNSISTEGLRKVARLYGAEIKSAKGYTLTPEQGSMLEIKKIADKEMRDIISAKDPDLKKLNAQFNFWANLDDVVSATSKRRIGQQMFMPTLGGLAGAASGGDATDRATKAAIFATTVSAMKSPGWNMVSAQVKDQIAKRLLNTAIPTAAKEGAGKMIFQKYLEQENE